MTSSTTEPVVKSNEDVLPKLLPLVAKAVKLAQDLPAANTPAYIYYNDFPQYKTISAGQSKKVLSIIQHALDALDAKSNILDVPTVKNPREKLSSIIDANDRILERLSKTMDLEEDPGRKTNLNNTSENLVVAVERRQNTSLEWLRKSEKVPSGQALTDDKSGSMLKLLTSPSIRRPQTSFSIPPDNSPSPFRPRLLVKPNGIRSLAESLSGGLSETDESPHPYMEELERFAYYISDWKPLSPQNPCPSELASDYYYVDDANALDEAVRKISLCKEVAVDLEHHSHRSYLGITCLIQLSTRTSDFIIDTLALRDHVYKLNHVFTNPKVVKIFHGSESDLMWLQRDFSVYVVNLFDTAFAARALKMGRYSLSFVLYHYLNVKLNKKYQLADWRMRPLPEELVKYARSDTHYLIHVAALMSQELEDRDLLHPVLEQCRQLCMRSYTKPVFDPLGYLNIYRQAAGANFNHRQLYALEQLYALRDSIARREDESLHYVLPNHMLRVISEVLPRESSGLFACCNPIPPLVRKYVHDLHKIVQDARNRPLNELIVSSTPDGLDSRAVANDASGANSTAQQTKVDVLSLAAPPHDRSRKVQTSESQPKTLIAHPTLQQKQPSALGQLMCTSLRKDLGWQTNNINKKLENLSVICGFDVDRMLLNRLLSVLSKAAMKVNEANSDESTSLPTSNQIPMVPQASPAETLIKLNMNEQDNNASLSTTDTAPPETADPSESLVLYDSEEVVILREEMPSKSKRTQRNPIESGQRKPTMDGDIEINIKPVVDTKAVTPKRARTLGSGPVVPRKSPRKS